MDTIHTTDQAIVHCSNSFFSTIGTRLAATFLPGVQCENPYPNFIHTFIFQKIRPKFILKQLQTLKESKATGLDNINSRLLKDASDVVAQPLTNIMNRSLVTGLIPFSWKKARVTPIYKDSDPLHPSNYRPISILPVVMKVFERAVQKQLLAYLKKNAILCEQQSGFREKHSTATATTEVTDFILKNMDQGLYTGAVYLDLKKAFDSVDIDTLLFKFDCLGIRNTEHLWFQNYLTNRSQCVIHNGSLSQEKLITSGVPQGSILGPVLFVLFVNDFPSVARHSKVVLYADDTVLLFSSTSSTEIQSCLNEDLISASKWFQANKLLLNISKCKWMLFGSQKRLKKCALPEISINNSPLEHVSTYKYLGLLLDCSLNWQPHINYVCKKLKQRLGVLKRVRQYLDEATSTLLYNALILPMADYCDTVYGSCGKTLLAKVERLLCKGGKIILNVPMDTSTRCVLNSLKWLTLTERITLHRNIMVYKSLKGLAPNYISKNFHKITHSHNTRNSSNLVLPRCKTNMGQQTFQFLGAKDYNALPSALKNSASIDIFKSQVVKHILSSRSSHYFIPA